MSIALLRDNAKPGFAIASHVLVQAGTRYTERGRVNRSVLRFKYQLVLIAFGKVYCIVAACTGAEGCLGS